MSIPADTILHCPFIIDLVDLDGKEFRAQRANFIISKIQQAGFSAIYTTETCLAPFGGCFQVDLVMVSAKDDSNPSFDLKSIQEEFLFKWAHRISKAEESGILNRAIKV